jgi:transglutaminase-like putative cysteine protease
MLFTLIVIVATWVNLQTGSLSFKPRLRIAGLLLLQAIPLSLILFVLFPRIQGPLWGMPQDAYAKSGLSDTMSPGSMSKLSLSDEVAFRATFSGTAPMREQMYWRGPVLWDFDGTTWKRGQNATLQKPILADVGTAVDYTVTLEPHNKLWLFALDMPTNISVAADMAPDFQLLSRTPVNGRLRYNARSQLTYRANLNEPPQQMKRALNLPRGYNPKALQLAAEWRVKNTSDEAIANTALRYFNQNAFSYTLEPPLLGTHSVDDFLFTTKQGFCEHYASSFVFLMRAAGVPARVVTGYQGGEYNELGGYYILRQADAHAWAEVWLANRGWVRVDPTAAISPARIQSGLSAALPDNAALPFMARNPPQWMRDLRFNWDAMANQWNQWVLGYDSERQFAFLTRLGMEDVTWQKMVMNMAAVMSLLVGIFTLILLRRLMVRQNDPVQAAWLKVCKKLAKVGLARAPHEGPEDYAARVIAARPQLADTMHDITTRYTDLRYGGTNDEGGLRAFRDAVKAFKL